MAETKPVLCEVPCRSVDDKLIDLWHKLDTLVTWKAFTILISSIGLIALFLVGLIFTNQSTMSQTLSSMQSDIKVIQSDIKHMNKTNTPTWRGSR